jgi:hypothetical protein
MTKIIVRPDNTTYVLDFAFHYIKDATEMKNVASLIGDKEIFQVMRTVDPNTFQPLLFFAIPEKDKPFSDWMKYVTILQKSDD